MFPPDQRRELVAAMACISLVGIVIGIIVPTLALEMDRQGAVRFMIGLSTATPAVAAMIAAPFVGRLARRFGVVPCLLASLCVSSCCFVIYYLVKDNWLLWFPIRFINGTAYAIIFVLVESWVNALAHKKNRGAIMGLYTAFFAASFAFGPAVLAFSGTAGFLPYAISFVLSLLALLPLCFVGKGRVHTFAKSHVNYKMRRFLWVIPPATMGAFILGAVETQYELLPVYAVYFSIPVSTAVLMITAVGIGNLFFQVPIGVMSDRFGRFTVLLWCGILGFIAVLALPFVMQLPWVLFPLLVITGGILPGIYTVGLAIMGDNFKSAELVSINAAFIFLYNAGGMVGPILAGWFMDISPRYGFTMAASMVMGAFLVIFFLYRRKD